MPLEKLASYMNTTVDELESNLLCFKNKMMNVVWTKGASALQGEFQSESEVTLRQGKLTEGEVACFVKKLKKIQLKNQLI